MSKRSQEKRRARAKEKAKLARRERGTSPLSRLAGNEAGIECWLHYDATDDRMVNITVFRPVRGGGSAAAFFLVDYDCIGLKDAFYRLDVVPSEIVENYRERSRQTGTRFIKGDLAEVRRMVGGAVRWTMEQGFHLPADTQRSLKILGEVEVEGADISRFGAKEGGLYYVGRARDLEKKLIDQTLEEFMARDDVNVLFLDDADAFKGEEGDFDEEFDDDDTPDEEFGEAADRAVEKMERAIIRGVRKWCRQQGREPHELLPEVAKLRVTAVILSLKPGLRQGLQQETDKLAEHLIAAFPAPVEEQERLRQAYQQVKEYLASLPRAADLPAEEDDEDLLEVEELVQQEEAIEGVAEAGQRVRGQIKDAVTRWCIANGQKVHERIDDAIALMVDSTLQVDHEGSEAEISDAAFEAGSTLLSLESPADQAAIIEARAQLAAYAKSFESPDAMRAAFGLEAEEPEETSPTQKQLPARGEQ
jgi:hypothetical protein